MSRRLEITVPNDWSPPVRAILETECGLNSKSGKPFMMTEVSGKENTIFMIVIAGPAVSGILEALRKNGIGTSVGRIMLATIDYLKPDLSAPLVKPQLTLEQMQEEAKKPPPLKSFQHFKKARKTTEEMFNEISNNANININTWMNLIGASTMAAGGLTTNVLVFTVAAMLVSPIMGPILGMVMGYRVADFNLFRTGFMNELKMAIVTYLTGCFYGILLGDVSKTYKWPNSQMMHEGMAFNLVISIIVSAAAGMVLGISLTSAGGNALVGTAISAGLLPPLVNAGMLHAYATFYVYDTDRQSLFYEIGTYSVLFYATHVITIVIVANFVFYLKDVDPRFREGEDSNIQLLTDHRKAMTEREKAQLFIGNIKADLKKDVKVFTEGVKDFFTGNISIGRDGIVNRRTGESSRSRRKSRNQHNTEYETIREEDEYDEESHYHESEQDPHSEPSYMSTSAAAAVDEEAGEGRSHASSVPKMTSTSGKFAGDVEMTPTTPTTPGKRAARERVIEFYRRYNPTKLASVDDILSKYDGKEDELLRKLRKQYNV
eukprot:gene12118-8665_t